MEKHQCVFSRASRRCRCSSALFALRRRRKTDKDDTRIIEVLDFWFKEPTAAASFGSRAATIATPRTFSEDRFADVVEEALAGKLEHWRRTPRGSIALVVVLDQFSRHVHRDQDHTLTAKRADACTGTDFLSRWDLIIFDAVAARLRFVVDETRE